MAADTGPNELSAREVIIDPYPAYRRLRERSPFNYQELPAGRLPGIDRPLRSWALMKFSDVYGALRDYETVSSARPLVVKTSAPLVLIFDDPPRHTRFRRLVNKAFTVKRVEAVTPWITSVAQELIDQVGADELDIVQHYTVPLPVKVIARLLGIPETTTKHSNAGATPFSRWSPWTSLNGCGASRRWRATSGRSQPNAEPMGLRT